MDPLGTNKKGINVLHLMAKRNQVEMARRCLEAVKEDKARVINLVNNSSNIGEMCISWAREPFVNFQLFPRLDCADPGGERGEVGLCKVAD